MMPERFRNNGRILGWITWFAAPARRNKKNPGIYAGVEVRQYDGGKRMTFKRA
jgi:hypothetical protein